MNIKREPRMLAPFRLTCFPCMGRPGFLPILLLVCAANHRLVLLLHSAKGMKAKARLDMARPDFIANQDAVVLLFTDANLSRFSF